MLIQIPRIAKMPYTRTDPNGGVTLFTHVENKMPPNNGPSPFASDPPSIDKPFKVPRWCEGTVLFVVMVIDENTTAENARIAA
mmetsp:Transcript_609/g.1250  ORF Transcript_609/g.1250 Transcript_609/m.1250 type:complete len:83 (+) Transcript_609:369-617(+)